MKIHVILLSFKQLCLLGVQIGHESKTVFFLSSWMFYAWYKDIFLMDLHKTVLGLRSAVTVFYKYAKFNRPLWFVCIRSKFGPLVARYAYVTGELFNVYWWINGSVTNFYRVLGWSQVITRLMMANIHDLRFRDKKRLARFIGLVNHRKRLPGAGFVPTLINNNAPADEFQKARLQSVGIIDSNVSSLSSMIPIPGNDDSIVCINFYCYLLSRAALAGKIDFVFLWNWQIRRRKRKKVITKFHNLKQFIYLYNNLYKFSNENIFFDLFDKIYMTELVYNIPVESTINKWLIGTQLIGNFKGYPGKLYFSNEISQEEDFKMILL